MMLEKVDTISGKFGNYTKKNGDNIPINMAYDFILKYIFLDKINDIISIELFESPISMGNIYCSSPLLEKVITPSNMFAIIHCSISAPINPFDYPNLEFRLK